MLNTHGLFAIIVHAVLSSGSRLKLKQQATNSTGCDCWVKNANSKSIGDWIELAIMQGLEQCCENYADVFGWWGQSACPSTLYRVARAIDDGTTVASGGKSGIAPIIAGDYVIKTINAEERGYLDGVLDNLRKQNMGMSLLAPICRVLKVTGPKVSEIYVMVMAAVGLRGPEVHPFHRKFDLKGNWDYSGRKATSGSSVLKDGNFHELFPDSLYLKRFNFFDTTTGENAAGAMFSELWIQDTQALLGSGLMDYSLLVDMVEVCPFRSPSCPDQVSVSVDGYSPGPLNGRPLTLGTFTKTCLPCDAAPYRGRPIYVNSQKEYLYYWEDHHEWVISRDPKEFSRWVAKTSDHQCPHEGNERWAVHKPGGGKKSWKYDYNVTLDIVQQTMPMFDQESISKLNHDRPLAFAVADGKTYAMAVGIIDLFMHEEHRGFVNTAAAALTFSDCSPDDIDPIPALEYRVRFMRMVGYKDPNVKTKNGKYCGGCLGSRRRVSYTYIRHAVQELFKYRCDWGA